MNTMCSSMLHLFTTIEYCQWIPTPGIHFYWNFISSRWIALAVGRSAEPWTETSP